MFLVHDYLKKAHKKADRRLIGIEKNINKQYDLKFLTVRRLFARIFKKYEPLWDSKLKELNSGEITKEDFQQYMVNNIVLSKEWKTIVSKLTTEITNANEDILSDINKSMVEIYVDNYNAMTNALKDDIDGK